MRRFIFLIVVLNCIELSAQVGINNATPHLSAALDITSTTKGLLPPRMTKVQRDSIPSPADGLIISCTNCSIKGLQQYINGAWQTMISSNTGNYGTVVNPETGKVWLDRNLGASQVATSSTDVASYGSLFQWGRNADGHQNRTSGTISSQSTDFFTTNGLFIIVINWLSAAIPASSLWSGTAAENNPCPSGFRIPTAAEWEQERRTWNTNDAAGAFGSHLKLPLAGYRTYNSNGLLLNVNSNGYYWSSTISGNQSRDLFFTSDNSFIAPTNRGDGMSIRCVMD